ncbi:MAG: glycosyltransferase family 2 protein [Anaerolineae bacterium]|nr:glycosyltransferase family 2 protein [Anaerolineae bacterium]
MTDLSIVIVNWNTRELLAGCLESLICEQSAVNSESQGLSTVHGSLTTEVIVVDNASSDGSAAMVRECFPTVQVIENRENVGFARANNQAICHSRGRYVLLLNSDTVVHAGALETLVAFMDARPQAGACGPRLLNGDGTLQPSVFPMLTPIREFWQLSFFERLYPRATYRVHDWDTTTARQVDFIKGACFLVRRDAFHQIGLLDDRYFMYTEEVDLCYRLAQASWQLWYVPASKVIHFGGASSQQMREEMVIQLYRSKLQFYRRFGGVGRVRQARVLLTLAYVPRYMVASVAALIRPDWRSRARTYRRILAELHGF